MLNVLDIDMGKSPLGHWVWKLCLLMFPFPCSVLFHFDLYLNLDSCLVEKKQWKCFYIYGFD